MNYERIDALHTALTKAADARALVQSSVWADAWEKSERELLEQFLGCGPTEDAARYRLQIAIEASRAVRRLIEHQGRTVVSLEKELATLKGETPLRIA
jgi:hypothetical protein